MGDQAGVLVLNQKQYRCEACSKLLKKSQTYPSMIKRGGGRFCSRNCSRKYQAGENSASWKGGLVKKPCEVCGATFEVKKATLKKGQGKFCSRECFGRALSQAMSGKNNSSWRGGPVEQVCVVCKAQFFVGRARAKNTAVRFCSRKCKGAWQTVNNTKQNNPSWKGGQVERVCIVCGVLFFTWACHIEKGRGNLCSLECRKQWQVGKNTSNWRGGKSFEPYPSTFNSVFKCKIRARDNQACALCGKSARCVHHVDYVKSNTTPENCVTLCASCHSKTNANRFFWQSVLSGFMKEMSCSI